MALHKFKLFTASRTSFLNLRQCSSMKTPTTTSNDSIITYSEEKSSKPSVEKSDLPAKSSTKKEVIIPHWTKCHVSRHKTKEELLKIPFTSSVTSHYANPQNLVKIPYVKPFESTYVANRPLDPLPRIRDVFRRKKNRKTKFLIEGLDAFYDIVVVGGGAMGCSIAFWLAQRINEGFNILVVERDPKVCKLDWHKKITPK